MKKKSNSKSAFFNFRVLIGLFVFLAGVFLALLSVGFFSSAEARPRNVDNANADAVAVVQAMTPVLAKSFNGDVRTLRPVPAKEDERDWEEKLILPALPIGPASRTTQLRPAGPIVEVPMPPPIQNFEGIARLDVVTGGQAGTGFPPDTNGEVGLNHYILAVNAAYVIYDKATGTQVAGFTENSLFSGGPTGTLCDTNSDGDPVMVYDQLANRWFLTNFAFTSFPGPGPFYQCFAVSQTSDPVAGGWFLYAVRIDQGAVPSGTLPDYGKFGHWNDGCLYMGANGFGSNGAFNGTIFASFSKNDMENGLPLTSAVGFGPSIGSSLFPTNLLGTQPEQMPPPGTPNYFVRNASSTTFQVRTFTPGQNCGAGGTLSAATTVSHVSGPGPNNAPQPNDPGNLHSLDSLGTRIMQKVQYRKVGSAESLWVVHSARTAAALMGPLWAQLDVTGGTIATTPVQQGIHAPDDTLWRWMGSIAADQDGNVAIGYSTSNGVAPNFPSIAYAGRLATDPPNTLPQTETQLIAGMGSQLFDCGGGPCHRWGDYSSMSVDPTDDCTFWYTNEYYPNQDEGNPARRNWHTRIGSFKFGTCGGGGTPTPTPTASPTPTPTPTASPTPTPTATCAPGYTTTTGTGNITAGGTDIGNHCDDCFTQINLPFPVNVYGAPTSVAWPASNGDLHLANPTLKSLYYQQCVPVDPSPDGPWPNTLFPYYDDLRTDVNPLQACADCGIFTQTLGTAPNRQFIIRWKTTYFNNAGNAEFEVILTEGSDTLSVIYGDTSGDNGLTAASGIQQDLSVFTSFSCVEATLTPGLRVDYIPTSCGSPTPSPTPSSTPTATATATATATPTPTSTPRPTPTPRPVPTPRPRPTPPPRP